MSKRFLKQIGLVTLLMSVSSSLPQSGQAMHQALWDDYHYNQTLRASVHKKTSEGWMEQTARTWQVRTIEKIPRLEPLQTISGQNEEGYWFHTWYLCNVAPEQHPFYYTLTHANRLGSTKPFCTTCQKTPPSEKEESSWVGMLGEFVGGVLKGFQGE